MLHQLPPELLIELCKYLQPQTLCAFRLTCRLYADVAAQTLFKEVHLMFRDKSFKNLLEIARHPVLSSYVTSIYYEAVDLEEPSTREDWERGISPPGPRHNDLDTFPQPPGPGASERELRQHRREVKRWAEARKPQNHYSDAELSRACQFQ
jgi:hypothetical protein